MSNPKRPSTARTRTPKDEAARKAALDDSYSIKVDDTVYTIRPADVTGLVEMRVRRETGYALLDLLEQVQAKPGLDLVACVMFAAEISAGREADLEKILGSISWASDVEVVDDTEAEPVPQP